MKLKIAVGVTLGAVAVVVVVLFAMSIGTQDTSNQQANVVTNEPSNTQQQPIQQDNASSSTSQTDSSSTAPCGQKGASCTTAEVSLHDTVTDCWVIYNGNYYDVTTYVRDHPGGSSVFNSETCGKDIQAYLEGSASSAGLVKRHSASAYRDLESYLIGPVRN